MNEEIIVQIRFLSEDNSPIEISDCLGLIPSKSWKKGEVNSKTQKIFKENGWELESSLDEKSSLTEKIEYICKTFEPFHKKMKKLSNYWYIEISCIVYYKDSPPALNFSNSLVSKISKISASLDIDLYDIS